jgi:transposase
MSRLEPTLEPERQVRRIEVITGAGGRRRWTVDDKARIVEETLDPGASVSVVARRHGLTPQQLFGWRREARRRSEVSEDAGPSFIPAMVELASTHRRRRQQAAPMAAIELDIGGVRVRIGAGAKASIVSAVIRALKETS